METMHYSEKRKSSKGFVIFFLAFVIIGGAIIVFAMANEEEPVVIGKNESEIQRLVDVEAQEKEKEETKIKNQNITYEVSDVTHNDSSNTKIKSDITLPKITVEGEELTEINEEIDKEFTDIFAKLKDQMKSVESKYTYIVSYNVYENMVDTDKILSVTIYQRVRDDSAKKNTTEKVSTYNIDLATKEKITEFSVASSILGKDYKSIIKEKVQDHVVENNMMKEEDFTYAITGLEDFYLKDGVFHIIFNEEKLVDKKFGVLDIEVPNVSKK